MGDVQGYIGRELGRFTDEILDRTGIASGCSFTVRSILYIIAGHELHHVNVLKELYL